MLLIWREYVCKAGIYIVLNDLEPGRFLVYGLDKGKARKGSYRISEKTLLLMTYVGGGLGAWAGGTHFRHKTQKKYFQLAWAVGVLIDALLIYWMWK